jgi:hypothetical protein
MSVEATASEIACPFAHPANTTFVPGASSPTTVLEVFGALRFLDALAPTIRSAAFVVGGGVGATGFRSVSPVVDCDVKPPLQNQLPERAPLNQTLFPFTLSPRIQPSKVPTVFGANGGSIGGFDVFGSKRRLTGSLPEVLWFDAVAGGAGAVVPLGTIP